jgi:hypothetical protein
VYGAAGYDVYLSNTGTCPSSSSCVPPSPPPAPQARRRWLSLSLHLCYLSLCLWGYACVAHAPPRLGVVRYFLGQVGSFARVDMQINYGANAPSSGVVTFVLALQRRSGNSSCTFAAAAYDDVAARGGVSTLQCTAGLAQYTGCPVGALLPWQIAAIVCGVVALVLVVIVLFFVVRACRAGRRGRQAARKDAREEDGSDNDSAPPPRRPPVASSSTDAVQVETDGGDP